MLLAENAPADLPVNLAVCQPACYSTCLFTSLLVNLLACNLTLTACLFTWPVFCLDPWLALIWRVSFDLLIFWIWTGPVDWIWIVIVNSGHLLTDLLRIEEERTLFEHCCLEECFSEPVWRLCYLLCFPECCFSSVYIVARSLSLLLCLKSPSQQQGCPLFCLYQGLSGWLWLRR